MNKFEITVGSLPDKENLVADIFLNDIQVAEISQEHKDMVIQIFSYDDIDCWEFSLNDFLKVIEEAKERLMEVG